MPKRAATPVAAVGEPHVCPICGEQHLVRGSTTVTGQLVRDAISKQGLTRQELADKAGTTIQALGFLIAGRQGSAAYQYLGMKRAPKDRRPAVVYRVADALGISRKKLAAALLEDQMNAAGGTYSLCSKHPRLEQPKQKSISAKSGMFQPTRAA